LGELAHLTPGNIQLVSLSADLPMPEATKGKSREDPTADDLSEERVVLEGIIRGDRQAFDAALARYLLRLKNSLMFSKPSVTERATELFDGEPVLRFVTQLDLG